MAQELNVNVHARALRAAEKFGPDPRMQEVLDDPSWRDRFKDRWFKWERNLIVAGKVIEKGWVVPQALGIALILAMLSCTGVLYWRIIDKQAAQDKAWEERFSKQNELLIRLDQSMIIKERIDSEKQRKQTEDDQLQDMQIQDLKDKLLVINAKRGK